MAGSDAKQQQMTYFCATGQDLFFLGRWAKEVDKHKEEWYSWEYFIFKILTLRWEKDSNEVLFGEFFFIEQSQKHKSQHH